MSADMLLALNLAGLGMLFVFSFLALLVFLINVNAWLINRFMPPEDEDSERAALSAASIHHRRKKS